MNTKICLFAKTGDYLPGLGRHLVGMSPPCRELAGRASPHTQRKVACLVSRICSRERPWGKTLILIGDAYFGISLLLEEASAYPRPLGTAFLNTLCMRPNSWALFLSACFL